MAAADLKEAIENFQSQAARYQSFIDLADQLAKVGDLQRATSEARGARDAAQRDLDDLKAQIAEDQAKADTLLADATAQADKLKSDASAQASQILAVAKSNAEAKADAILSEAQGKADAATKAADDATARANEAEARVTEAETQLADLETRITAARAAAANMLKG